MSIRPSRFGAPGLIVTGLLILTTMGWATREHWRASAAAGVNRLQALLGPATGSVAEGENGSGGHPAGEHAGHDHASHDHPGHDEAASLHLSEQAQKNIGLTVGKVRTSTFVRTVTIPGIVVERRGWTKTRVVAPLTGIVTKIHVIEGEALCPGQPLFDLRLTHEDLVQAQVEFLKTHGELDVVKKEIERLKPIVEKGAVPQKSLLDRIYDRERLEAMLRAQHESLLLHGLSQEQAEEIARTRTLRANLTVYVPGSAARPTSSARADGPDAEPIYVVNELAVENGRLVTAGDRLLTLSDYSELYIEGNAFEQDGQLVAEALKQSWKVNATVENRGMGGTVVPDLPMLYLDDEVDPASRTLHFFLRLPNERIRDVVTDGHRFINWRFKPGQRTRLRVPVEEWPNRIVLPAEALAQDGPESYVFQQNGDHFDRRSVEVEYRDSLSVVIGLEGSLFPGEVVALSGAQQMLMALKNKSGGPVDPHAGHSH